MSDADAEYAEAHRAYVAAANAFSDAWSAKELTDGIGSRDERAAADERLEALFTAVLEAERRREDAKAALDRKVTSE